VARWSALALGIGVILPSVGCQVEYAGMTLPSGRYMHDDVQFFPSSPDFPWANTQAATQRARMQVMGIEPPPGEAGPMIVPPARGAIAPIQNQPFRETDVNASPLPPQGVPAPPVAAPPPGVPAPPGAGIPGGVPAPLPEGAGDAGAGVPAGGVPVP
jgi:hypothetical protein